VNFKFNVILHCRAQEVLVCHLLTVRTNSGNRSFENAEDEGSGFCYLQGYQQRYQCLAVYARLSILRQTNGMYFASKVVDGM